MKSTSWMLMNYFVAKDTAKIRALFEVEDNPAYRMESAELLNDCHFFLALVKKYGFPNADSLKMTKGQGGENVVYVTLMEKEDAVLNLKKCQLGILFFPDRFLKNPAKILTYQLVRTPLSHPEKKLKIAPAILKTTANTQLQP